MLTQGGGKEIFMDMKRRLYKSDSNKVLCGVCGGIGEYFGVDPVIVRLILVILCCVGFSGVIAYIIAALIIPRKPEEFEDDLKASYERTYKNPETVVDAEIVDDKSDAADIDEEK